MNSTKGKSKSTERVKTSRKALANQTSGEERSRSTRARKGTKDPLAPKKPMTAFLIFSNEERARLKASKPELKFGEVGKELGRLWRELSDSMKKKYQKLAEEEKKGYDIQMNDYLKNVAIA